MDESDKSGETVRREAELFTRGVRTHDATIKLVLDKSGAPEKQPVRHRVETYCQGK